MDIVYFDLETQRSANDVGGWGHKDRMGMSVGVTYSTALETYKIYAEHQAEELIEQLKNADLVVGYNHLYFDYAVLQAYSVFEIESQTRNLDLMLSIENACGVRPKLDSVAEASIGAGKTAEGLQAIKWWREGKIKEIAEYCAYDVKVTRYVHEYGVEKGFIKFRDKSDRDVSVEIPWKLTN